MTCSNSHQRNCFRSFSVHHSQMLHEPIDTRCTSLIDWLGFRAANSQRYGLFRQAVISHRSAPTHAAPDRSFVPVPSTILGPGNLYKYFSTLQIERPECIMHSSGSGALPASASRTCDRRVQK